MKQDIYQKVTDKIMADLEKGELSWLKPWSAGNMEGRIVKPLRHNGMAYNGINVLMLWGAAIEGGLSLAVLDDLPPSQGIRRTREKRRAWQSRRLCQHHHQDRRAGRRQRGRAHHSVHEGIQRFQRRADRRLARAFLHQARAGHRSRAADRACRQFFRSHGRRHPPWREFSAHY
jgi:hypothetical protein